MRALASLLKAELIFSDSSSPLVNQNSMVCISNGNQSTFWMKHLTEGLWRGMNYETCNIVFVTS